MSSWSSALICPACKKGYMLCSDVSNIRADWSCQKCKAKMAAEKISRVSNAVKAKADELEYDARNLTKCDIDAHLQFLNKYGQVLHPNHVVMCTVKYGLAKMYGRMDGYQADKLTDEQFQYKQKLCEDVLKVFDIIMPGYNRMRGVMLYELHLPLVMLANRQLQRGPGKANPDQIKKGLKKGLDCLIRGLDILKMEPEGSFESKIVQGSKDSVTELRNWCNTISQAI